jgi:hypothetical protein
VSALVLAWLLLAPPAAAPAQTPEQTPAPRLAVEPAAFDFGRVLPERTLSKQFAIRNFGSADLAIEKVSTTCGCTAALLDDKVVKPGGRATLRVTLETRNYEGKVRRSVLIRSNDPRHPTTELKLEATVTPGERK